MHPVVPVLEPRPGLDAVDQDPHGLATLGLVRASAQQDAGVVGVDRHAEAHLPVGDAQVVGDRARVLARRVAGRESAHPSASRVVVASFAARIAHVEGVGAPNRGLLPPVPGGTGPVHGSEPVVGAVLDPEAKSLVEGHPSAASTRHMASHSNRQRSPSPSRWALWPLNGVLNGPRLKYHPAR